jgi:hypothetical protein
MHDRVRLPVLTLGMGTIRATSWVVERSVDGDFVIAAIDGDAIVEILVCSRQAAETLLLQIDAELAEDER